jgi:hypothetical protein
MVIHILEMGNQFAIGASRDRGLMHMKCAGKCRADVCVSPSALRRKTVHALFLRQSLNHLFVACDHWSLRGHGKRCQLKSPDTATLPVKQSAWTNLIRNASTLRKRAAASTDAG